MSTLNFDTDGILGTDCTTIMSRSEYHGMIVDLKLNIHFEAVSRLDFIQAPSISKL